MALNLFQTRPPRGRPKKNLNQSQSPNSHPNDGDELPGSSATDAEPAATKEKAPRGRTAASKAELDQIQGALTVALMGLGNVLPVVTRDVRDGQVIVAATPNLVASIMQLAEQDKKVRAFLLTGTKNTAALGVLLTVVFTVVLPILDNHNMRPALFKSEPTPDASIPNG